MSSNVEVVARFRPPNRIELANNAADGVVDYNENGKTLALTTRAHAKSPGGKKKFTFDAVFGPVQSQSELYDRCITQRVDDVFGGYNCTIFAYGQTGR
jgi:kinesin family protein 11